MTLLTLRGVTVEFSLPHGGTLRAVDGVDLDLEAGSMTALIGESGSGKTTLGKVCLGMIAPGAGSLLVEGRAVTEPGSRWPKELRRRIQVVHQDPFSSLNPVRTVKQSLAAPLLHHGLAGPGTVDEEIVSLLEEVELCPGTDFLHRYPFQLSGGQKQRVALARAVSLQPSLVVADEPLSAVDASLRRSLLDLLKRLNRQKGIAFLLITHDLAAARYFAPEGTLQVMYLGRVVECGPMRATLAGPRHPYLKALLGAALLPRSEEQASEMLEPELDEPARPSKGCGFYPRCRRSSPRCREETPSLVGDPGRVACHHPLTPELTDA